MARLRRQLGWTENPRSPSINRWLCHSESTWGITGCEPEGHRLAKIVILGMVLLIVSCGMAFSQTGMASYYSSKHHGRRTASGERFNMHGDTCAHRTAPMGMRLRVYHAGNVVVCRVNDRGPRIKGRIIDLSYALAKKLGIVRRGVAKVHVSR